MFEIVMNLYYFRVLSPGQSVKKQYSGNPRGHALFCVLQKAEGQKGCGALLVF